MAFSNSADSNLDYSLLSVQKHSSTGNRWKGRGSQTVPTEHKIVGSRYPQTSNTKSSTFCAEGKGGERNSRDERACSSKSVRIPFQCCYKASRVPKSSKKRVRTDTYNDAVLAYVDVGTDLGRVDNTVLLYEDVIANVKREKSHPVMGEGFVPVYNAQTDVWHRHSPDHTAESPTPSCGTRGKADTKEN